jgi:hypothetical protein
MIVCLYEDRPQQLPGVKLLLLSLARHCPDWRISLHVPGADQQFLAWVEQFDNLTAHTGRLESSGSFNVKPSVLLQALNNGDDECLWIDTDVLINGNLKELLNEPPEVVIVSQDPWEYASGSTNRARTWKLDAGRILPGPLNSAVVRVTSHHLPLVESWQAILRQDWYQQMQKLPVIGRDQNALGDQDGLSALLASKDFADIPVKRLKHPTEILQHHGAGAFSLQERWQTMMNGLPPLLHAMGTMKPWQMPSNPSLAKDFRTYYERYYLELSPYMYAARQYQAKLGEDREWLQISTGLGRFSHFATMGSPSLQGLTQSSLHRFVWHLRHRT